MQFPLREWMKRLGLVCVVIGALMSGGCGGSDRPGAPGQAEFEAVNRKITTNKDGAAHGDSPETAAAAGKFATSMKQALMFTGGGGKSFASGGDFVTMVVQRPDAVIVLCHVPELRNYKTDETRASLAELAWTVAQGTMAKLPGVTAGTKLMVGLRGVVSYGPVWEGKMEGDAEVKNDDVGGRKRFYPHFAAPEPRAPASTAAKEGA
jgi:hypothetical protein